MADNIETKVKEILFDILDIDEKNITPTATLMELGASSVDIVEIVAAFENEFDIEISDEGAHELTTLDKIVDYLRARAS
jgi:acyl carrier protein